MNDPEGSVTLQLVMPATDESVARTLEFFSRLGERMSRAFPFDADRNDQCLDVINALLIELEQWSAAPEGPGTRTISEIRGAQEQILERIEHLRNGLVALMDMIVPDD